MKTLTIFTPTYNRAYCLENVYDSLLRQSSNDFKWLIIDDGSTDTTREIVNNWIEKGQIEIAYIYKENGGLHTAYNEAIKNIDTYLTMCIDSDDYASDYAVEKVINHWKLYGSNEYAGIIGLDFFKNGDSIGGDLPNVKSLHIIELTDKYKYTGDTKMVHRTSLLKEVAPMPSFNNEKNFNPIYMFNKVDEKYPLLVLNENLCFVEYNDAGMSRNILSQYVNSPNSFAEMRRLNMSLSRASYSFIFKNAIHYVSSCLLAKDKEWLKKSPRKITTIIAVPFGILLYCYLSYKTK